MPANRPTDPLHPFARWVRRVFGPLLRPFVHLYVWWFRLARSDGTTYYVMPDVMSVFVLLCGLAVVGMVPSWGVYLAGLAALMVAPLLLLDVVRVSGGGVVCIQLFCFLPYRFRRVPAQAVFELYESWEDPSPTGVAFVWQGRRTERCVHLGTGTSAGALYASMRACLERQGWVQERGGGWTRR